MDYKPGDKFIVEISSVYDVSDGAKRDRPQTLYRMKHFNALTFDEDGIKKLEPYSGELLYSTGYKDGYAAGKRDQSRETVEMIERSKCILVSGETYAADIKASEKRGYDKAMEEYEKEHKDGVWLTLEEYNRLVDAFIKEPKSAKSVKTNAKDVAKTNTIKDDKYLDEFMNSLKELFGDNIVFSSKWS